MIMENEYDSEIPLQGVAKVSILMIGQQAIMDAYLCLLHLTAGILVGKLENFTSWGCPSDCSLSPL